MLVLVSRNSTVTIKQASLNDICEAVYMLTQLIPIGHVTSYKSIGKVLGVHPRVVAYCLKVNRNTIIVPCHRVVHSSRKLGGYSNLGEDFKKRILELEGVTFNNSKISAKYFVDVFSLLGEGAQ